ncbi:cell division cycle protein 123 homolog [Macadamia integrifolia]|uniref:cell division cycle protein 123 homolog n=1 Tax=Macadamia integrifolia TaxID=60698 RepID=UPI001C4F18DC|nr:cell division cycle protein 123 homolog [Macadamia integrifolia]XP_042513152.1 cell division cycle protein 123 homolog [Macadamia integrifolia]XP_042513153.1 cell division cycle protein 123 homolog [Macadamia integrifolia]XP_042513154.1 cell division cycle protein 123 homolog [Macadamia integrifolia]XP_042513155.1 cell division cycle protein 123 homolog [Macadamia integrifolia]XP_042513156.1 cell division cycle protein 123 homolog [Macadamia integrifolia]
MKQAEVNRCQIHEWYPKFKSVSIKTLIHELPETFVCYLLEESGPFILPQSVSGDDALPQRIHNPDEEEDYEVSEGSGDESERPPPAPCFPELELKIKESIKAFGGAVFPKLNWSAPKDSAWITTTGTLRCTSFSEIALVLRSSDSLIHDLCHAYDSCSDKTSSRPTTFFLALRKWYPSLLPEMEFRCFVRDHRLIGISQHEVTVFYPVLQEKKHELEVLVSEFFRDNVQPRFESENYTFDVYVTRDRRVKLMDFNPWGAFTLPLLFSWEELEDSVGQEGDYIEFRIIESRCTVRPGLKTAVPYDYLDTSSGSGWDQFLRNADEEARSQAHCPEAGA